MVCFHIAACVRRVDVECIQVGADSFDGGEILAHVSIYVASIAFGGGDDETRGEQIISDMFLYI